MTFLRTVFEWFASLSAKLPAIDIKAYFIVVLATIAFAGIVVAFTHLGSSAHKLKVACKKISSYLANVSNIDDDNVADFVNQCFSTRVPETLRDAWIEYLNVRFGYPSEIVSEKNVYDREIKHVKDIRSAVFIAVGLFLLAIFAFWGFGTIEKIGMSVIHFFGLVEVGIIFLLLCLLNKKVQKSAYEAFYQMQEDLDVKVDLQVEKNYATDSSPLNDLSRMLDEIVARNTQKFVEISDEMNALDDKQIKATGENTETPIETLISIKEAIDNVNNEETVEEPVEETQEEQTPVEETIEEPIEEQPQQEEVQVTFDDLLAEVPTSEEQDGLLPLYEDVQQEPVEEEETYSIEYVEERPYTPIYENFVLEDEDEEEEEEIRPRGGLRLSKGGLDDGSSLDAALESSFDIPEDLDEPVEQKAEESVEEVKEEPIEEPAEEEVQEDATPSTGEKEPEEEEEKIVYVMEDIEEDTEIVHPSKLAKLPMLLDYIMSNDMSRSNKLQIGMMLVGTYDKFKDSPDDKKIIKSCLSKYMQYLRK